MVAMRGEIGMRSKSIWELVLSPTYPVQSIDVLMQRLKFLVSGERGNRMRARIDLGVGGTMFTLHLQSIDVIVQVEIDNSGCKRCHYEGGSRNTRSRSIDGWTLNDLSTSHGVQSIDVILQHS